MSDTIKGFLINGEILHYDYNALDNVPDNGAGTFWATYGTTTSNEIEGAITSNKTVALNYENHIYYLSSILDKIAPNNVYLFRSEDNVANYQIMMSGSNWQPVRVLNWIQPSNDGPLPLLEDGVSSPGTSAKYSRGDHRHPMPEMNLGIDQTDGLLYFYINNVKHGNGISISGGSSGSGLTNEIKQALLQLASKVAYIDANGQNYYQDLYNALYSTPKTLVFISATYNQTDTIYTTDSLNDIPNRGTLTVVATYDDSSTETITNYTLSGNLTAGTSTITVIYSGKTTTINVNVTAVAGTYTITNNLTGCSTSNNATTIIENNSYNATITANSGYTLTGATVSVTMGGNTVTGAYSNGTISIANVTGDIVITVTAVAKTVSSISAVYTQSGTVYDTDTLDSLKDDLVVTAHFSDSSTQTVPAADYMLSGNLTVGTSTVTVSYGGKTTTFSVTVTKGQIDTTAEIIRSNVVLGHFQGDNPYKDMNRTNGGVTKIYDLDAATTILAPAGIIPTTGNVMYQSNGPASLYILDANDNIVNYVSVCAAKSSFGRWCQDAEGTMTEYTQQWTVSQYSKIQFSVDTRYLDDAYMYDKTTGQVWFAGENTPYYGMTNISEAGGE